MPDSQNAAGFSGSYTIHDGRCVMRSDPAPSPMRVQTLPLVFAHSPRVATPAMIASERGTGERSVRLPHSESLCERFPVTFTHPAAPAGWELCAATVAVSTLVNTAARNLVTIRDLQKRGVDEPNRKEVEQVVRDDHQHDLL